MRVTGHRDLEEGEVKRDAEAAAGRVLVEEVGDVPTFHVAGELEEERGTCGGSEGRERVEPLDDVVDGHRVERMGECLGLRGRRKRVKECRRKGLGRMRMGDGRIDPRVERGCRCFERHRSTLLIKEIDCVEIERSRWLDWGESTSWFEVSELSDLERQPRRTRLECSSRLLPHTLSLSTERLIARLLRDRVTPPSASSPTSRKSSSARLALRPAISTSRLHLDMPLSLTATQFVRCLGLHDDGDDWKTPRTSDQLDAYCGMTATLAEATSKEESIFMVSSQRKVWPLSVGASLTACGRRPSWLACTCQSWSALVP